MLFNMKPGVGRRIGIITEDSFTYTGSYMFKFDEDTGHFELALTSSGTLTWLVGPGDVDLFLVGNGQDGTAGQIVNAICYGGKGGDGGRTNTEQAELSGACTAVIGNETTLTNDGTTYTSANGQAPRKGGQGATVARDYNNMSQINKTGKDGVFAYNKESDETLILALAGFMFGPSGGGGHARNKNYYYSGQASVGGENAGGATGAGFGGTKDSVYGTNATGYGAGGGGGASDYYSGNGGGGYGSSGIILIRDHREVS